MVVPAELRSTFFFTPLITPIHCTAAEARVARHPSTPFLFYVQSRLTREVDGQHRPQSRGGLEEGKSSFSTSWVRIQGTDGLEVPYFMFEHD
jgi:hypothetical protein